MASYPYTRVASLLGMDDPSTWRVGPTDSPTTISGGRHALYSYRLCILEQVQDDGTRGPYGAARPAFRLHPDNSSPTTNRHIRAAAAVLTHNGYQDTGETCDGYAIYRKSTA